MGQKIHPGGFRVGYIQDWKSNWFEEKDFADVLNEDLKIREHIENKLAHAGLSDITIERHGEIAVDIHTARPGIVIGKSGSRSRRAAQRPAQAHRQTGQGEHPRGQAPRARRQTGRPVDRRAAAEPRRLPPRDETRAHLGDALRRQRREGPGLRPPRRCRDGPHRGLLGRPRAAAHAARQHRLRLLRGTHDDRPDRRQVLDQQGRGDARGLPRSARRRGQRAGAGRPARRSSRWRSGRWRRGAAEIAVDAPGGERRGGGPVRRRGGVGVASAAEAVVSDGSSQRSTPQPTANRRWIFVLRFAFGTTKGCTLRPRPAWFSLG